jgi:hypothetical protein
MSHAQIVGTTDPLTDKKVELDYMESRKTEEWYSVIMRIKPGDGTTLGEAIRLIGRSVKS